MCSPSSRSTGGGVPNTAGIASCGGPTPAPFIATDICAVGRSPVGGPRDCAAEMIRGGEPAGRLAAATMAAAAAAAADRPGVSVPRSPRPSAGPDARGRSMAARRSGEPTGGAVLRGSARCAAGAPRAAPLSSGGAVDEAGEVGEGAALAKVPLSRGACGLLDGAEPAGSAPAAAGCPNGVALPAGVPLPPSSTPTAPGIAAALPPPPAAPPADPSRPGSPRTAAERAASCWASAATGPSSRLGTESCSRVGGPAGAGQRRTQAVARTRTVACLARVHDVGTYAKTKVYRSRGNRHSTWNSTALALICFPDIAQTLQLSG